MTNAALGLSCDHLNGERGVTQKIKSAMQETAKQFVYIGFLLWEVKEYEYFYENGYNSVYEYAEQELGFKRSSTKNFIAICENFCRKDRNFPRIPTMFLDDRWSDYQYSQLTEMLSMSAAKREETKPSMTVKQLRQLKKEPIIEQVTMDELETKATGQTSGQTEETTKAKWKDASWWVPELYDRKLKLVIIEWNKNNRQFGIGYYNGHEKQWHDQPGNRIKVTHWMDLPYMPEKAQD